MRFRGFVAVVVLCLLAAGCGGNDDGKSTTTTHEKYVPVVPEDIGEGTGACGLLTQAEVSGAVGLPADAGKGTRSAGRESCNWFLRASGRQYVGVLSLDQGAGEYDRQLSAARGVEPLTGVGDKAFAINDSVWVVMGDRLLTVQVVTTQPLATRKQQALKLAQTASGRR